jgi:hypothetical protein
MRHCRPYLEHGPGRLVARDERPRQTIKSGAQRRRQTFGRSNEITRALGVDFQTYTHEQARVIVEIVTFIVCAGVGLAVDGESIPYVAGWGEDGALEAVTQFAQVIDQHARRVETALMPKQTPDLLAK